MSDTRAQDPWIYLTSMQGTRLWVKLLQISSYGEVTPVTGQGNAWITLCGTDSRWYVLDTVDVLHTILGNTSPAPPPV